MTVIGPFNRYERFINEDTYEGDINDPLSLNLYTYVSNNPLKYADPSGNFQALALCSMMCFSAGTKIKTNEGYKAIEDIQVGDIVQTKDEETGEVGYHPVEELFQRVTDEIYEVTVNGTTITTTAEHPFWVTEKGGWVEARNLKEGDKLQDPDGKEYPIEKIEIKNERTTVYNFRVQGVHNYFVTELEIWTHNCGRGASNPTSYYKVSNSGGGGVTYQRPVNVNRLPAGTGINITKKEMDTFFKSTMNKGLKSKGTGKNTSVTVNYGNSNVNVYRGGNSFQVKPNEVKIDKETGLVKTTHGISLDTNPNTISKFGGAYRIDNLPDGLKIIQRGSRLEHFEIVPSYNMPLKQFQELLNQIKVSPVK
ncbi:polymorphic toxin-type HINT domain-containing protein [Paenibacillaceae sp. P-4]|uniref:polymorphic toxin-type HINT domain-containing protein n=1 Tax=Paenibacillaceae bacterium P-4 TaxID=3160969 RepID=UPI0032E81A45